MTPDERFWAKVERSTPDSCWEWIAARASTGYGVIQWPNAQGVLRVTGAHRVSYSLAHGNIPDGLYVCHRCDNRGCVNPAHLFLGAHRDNIADMVGKRRNVVPVSPHLGKTHCKHGHEFSPENTRVTKQGRQCRACHRQRERRRRAT